MTSTIDLSRTQSTLISSNESSKDSIYNDIYYELEPQEDSKVYIIKKGLVNRSLLPILPNQPRKMLIEYTI